MVSITIWDVVTKWEPASSQASIYVEIEGPIDDGTPNEQLLIDFSLDGLNVNTYAGFNCEQLGRYPVFVVPQGHVFEAEIEECNN